MFKRQLINKFSHTDWLRNIFLAAMLLVASGTIFIYWWGDKKAEEALIEQMLHRETVLVREGAAKMGEFFQAREEDLLFLATLPSLVDPQGADVSRILQEKLVRLPAPVVDIIRVDAKGEVVVRGSEVPGVSNVADRDYFLWAKEKDSQGKVFYSQIAIARGGPAKGQKAFALATPIYQEDQFKGLVAVVISVVQLAKTYVSPLAVTENSVSFLVLGDETAVVPQSAELDGKSVKDLVGSEEKIRKGEDGKAVLGRTARLVAYTPVKLGGGVVWSLVTIVPQEDVLLFIGPLHTNQAGGVIFGLASLLLVSFLFIFGIRLMERSAYLKGFTEGRDHIKNKE